ncbi:hypothetical protein SAMN05519103_07706 [Rhizobiales bacterium GAS113]|nr:hypothetical protein SAMN05519103_07706 [Rhizobiales bacterium GAS113]
MNTPAYILSIELGGNLAILVALLVGLNLVLGRSDWPAEKQASAMQATGLILVAWFGAALGLSWLGFFQGARDSIPTIQIGVFAPIIIGVIALWRSETLARIIEATPQSWLVGIQVYRVIGFVFLLLFWSGRLPGVFALPAGIGDVLVGVLAPIVGFVSGRHGVPSRRLVLAWNVLGILDLVVAIGTGFLTSPSPVQLLSLDAPNELISAFPLVMVPVFAVPLSILLHFASLTKLRGTMRETMSPAAIPAPAR